MEKSQLFYAAVPMNRYAAVSRRPTKLIWRLARKERPEVQCKSPCLHRRWSQNVTRSTVQTDPWNGGSTSVAPWANVIKCRNTTAYIATPHKTVVPGGSQTNDCTKLAGFPLSNALEYNSETLDTPGRKRDITWKRRGRQTRSRASPTAFRRANSTPAKGSYTRRFVRRPSPSRTTRSSPAAHTTGKTDRAVQEGRPITGRRHQVI